MVTRSRDTVGLSCVVRGMIACLVMFFFLPSCEKPPVDDVIRAEKALKEARDAGAGRYAPAQFGKADEALARARHLIKSKQYKEAAGSSKLAEGYARQSIDLVPTAKEEYRNRSGAMLVEMEEKLDELKRSTGAVRNKRTKKKMESLLDPFAEKWGVQMGSLRAKIEKEEPFEIYHTVEAAKKEFLKELKDLEASMHNRKARPR